jgi:hypothetical protein
LGPPEIREGVRLQGRAMTLLALLLALGAVFSP